MKTWLTILFLAVVQAVCAQNFNDSIASLKLALSVEQEIWMEEAQRLAKENLKAQHNIAEQVAEIKKLKREASAQIKSSKKKRLLKKVLKEEKQLHALEQEFYANTLPQNEQYYKVFEDILKYTHLPTDSLAIEEVEKLKELAKKNMRKGKSKRRKSERVKDLILRVQEAKEAHTEEVHASALLIRAIKVCKGLVVIEKPKERIEAQKEEAVLEEKVEEPVFQVINVIYKVQIAADREELSKDKLFEIFRPEKGDKINSEIEDGWYKYSVGRFHTYEEASAFKEKIGVKGAFIIAYRDDEKIQLPESEAKQAEKKLDVIDGQEIVYRIQISATRQPATPAKVREMNLAGKIVNITQKDGWFKYTVGNFHTKNEAETAMRQMKISGAFVVGYTTAGEEIKL